MKKRVDIEKLLSWAYGQELPKAAPKAGGYGIGFRCGWDAVIAFGELSADVDVNRYGVVADRGATEAPHPDALIIAEAVAGLDGLVIDMPDGWCPDAGLGLGADGPALFARAMAAGTVIDRAGDVTTRRSARRLVEHHAIMGSAPDWRGGPCERDVERHQNGKPRWFLRERVVVDGVAIEREIEGWNHTAKRARPGAYTKTVFRPDPAPILIARVEYCVWHSALGLLCDDLAGRLSAYEVDGSARRLEPWQAADDLVMGGAILYDPRPASWPPKKTA
ncbi:MAG TPA: hypothetical protein PLJ34_03920 [Hyphomicrobiales bacterium]|nr:hypothetical protein [Hyphomicrobiales bacterium]